MNHNLALRMAGLRGSMTPDDVSITMGYETDVPLFQSGQEAADHGTERMDDPDERSQRMIDRLKKKQDTTNREAI